MLVNIINDAEKIDRFDGDDGWVDDGFSAFFELENCSNFNY